MHVQFYYNAETVLATVNSINKIRTINNDSPISLTYDNSLLSLKVHLSRSTLMVGMSVECRLPWRSLNV